MLVRACVARPERAQVSKKNIKAHPSPRPSLAVHYVRSAVEWPPPHPPRHKNKLLIQIFGGFVEHINRINSQHQAINFKN